MTYDYKNDIMTAPNDMVGVPEPSVDMGTLLVSPPPPPPSPYIMNLCKHKERDVAPW